MSCPWQERLLFIETNDGITPSHRFAHFYQCDDIEGAFTRQSKNGTDPTKTGTLPIVFAKKQ